MPELSRRVEIPASSFSLIPALVSGTRFQISHTGKGQVQRGPAYQIQAMPHHKHSELMERTLERCAEPGIEPERCKDMIEGLFSGKLKTVVPTPSFSSTRSTRG